jgi:hypothetical protein
MRKGKRLKSGIKFRRSKCPTCVFRPEKDGGIELSAQARLEIHTCLLNGTNQLCHHDNDQTICKGGRLFQLQIWSRMGVIAEPTEAALRDAMKISGVEPGQHIGGIVTHTRGSQPVKDM